MILDAQIWSAEWIYGRISESPICTVLSGNALDHRLNPLRSCGITQASAIAGNLMINEAIPILPQLLLFRPLPYQLTHLVPAQPITLQSTAQSTAGCTLCHVCPFGVRMINCKWQRAVAEVCYLKYEKTSFLRCCGFLPRSKSSFRLSPSDRSLD